MKGSDITQARGRLGLSRADLARILHIAQTTAFRWETSSSPRMDPLQRELVAVMVRVSMGDDAWKRGQELRAALDRAPMFALHVLLGLAYRGIRNV